MEKTLMSCVVEKKMYDLIKRYCFDNNVKIKEFIADALHTELALRATYCKSKKQN